MKYISLSSKSIIFAVILSAIVAIYWPLIFLDPILGYDDKFLISPLLNLEITAYFQRLIQFATIDLQPIRDLSFMGDLYLKNHLGFHTMHFTNVIIFLAASAIVFKKIVRDSTENTWAFFFLCFWMLSPITVSSVAWISARKHLLSLLFILIATHFVFKKDRSSLLQQFISILFYILSVLSHPINILWPLFVVFYFMQNSRLKEKLNYIVILFAIMLSFILLNLYYFNSSYLATSRGVDKIISSNDQLWGIRILMLGRYFYQTIFPVFPLPTPHYPGDVRNILGIIFLIVFIFLVYRKSSLKMKDPIWLGCVWFIFPLLTVIALPTNVFSSDTYLLTSSIGIYYSLAHIFSKLEIKLYKMTYLFLIFTTIISFNYARVFLSTEKLFMYSYDHEATPQSTAYLASYYTENGQYTRANELIIRLENWVPDYPFIPQLKAELIFFNSTYTSNQKLQKLETLSKKTASVYFYTSIISYLIRDKDKLANIFELPFKDTQNFRFELGNMQEKVFAYLLIECEFIGHMNCASLVDDYKKKITDNNFNTELFNREYSRLKNERI